MLIAGNPGNPTPWDCKEVYQRGRTQDGVYTIDPHCPNQKPFQVYCNNQYTREEWMDPRISLEVGQTMFRALEGSVVSTGLVWKRSTVSVQELPKLK